MATSDDFAPKKLWASAREANADLSTTGRLSIRIHDIDEAGRIKPLSAKPISPTDPRLIRTQSGGGFQVGQIVFDDVQLTAYSTQDSERLQLTQNHEDDGKPWLFGREVRTYSLACSLFVSDHDRQDGQFWEPRGITHWREIYEACRISTIARRRQIVNVVFDVLSLWGAFVQCDPRLDASSPHHLQVTIGFLVVHRDTIPDNRTSTFPTIRETGQPLYMSRESAGRLTPEDLEKIQSPLSPPPVLRSNDGLIVAPAKKAVPPPRSASATTR